MFSHTQDPFQTFRYAAFCRDNVGVADHVDRPDTAAVI
jgi:hypothetical protein